MVLYHLRERLSTECCLYYDIKCLGSSWQRNLYKHFEECKVGFWIRRRRESRSDMMRVIWAYFWYFLSYRMAQDRHGEIATAFPGKAVAMTCANSCDILLRNV